MWLQDVVGYPRPIGALDLDISNDVVALEGVKRGEPLSRVLVALASLRLWVTTTNSGWVSSLANFRVDRQSNRELR